MANKIEHNWIAFKNSALWEKCSNCKIERLLNCPIESLNKDYLYYYPQNEFPSDELLNLSCEEIIIKNIIE